MPGLGRDRSGATAVEFALVAPFLLALIVGSIQLTMGLWSYNALQQTAAETARCAAIASSACASVPAGCSSSSASICYALTLSQRRGVAGVTAAQVGIDGAVTVSGVAFTRVSISSSFAVLGLTIDVQASGMFPNSS